MGRAVHVGQILRRLGAHNPNTQLPIIMRISRATAALVGVRPVHVRSAARFARMPMTSLAEAPSSIYVPTATGLNSIVLGLSE